MKAIIKIQTRKFLARYSDDPESWTLWDFAALIGLGFAAAQIYMLIEAALRWVSA